MKKLLQENAIRLRQSGYSLQEISSNLSISKSTASLWVRNVILDIPASQRLGQRLIDGSKKGLLANKVKRAAILGGIMEKVSKQMFGLQKSVFLCKLLCALLYWCEGEKNSSSVRFTNSDPVLVKTFLMLLRTGFRVDEKKLRVCLHLHAYHNETKQRAFWSRVTSIRAGQFIKTFHKKSTGKAKKVDYQGCVSVRYHDHLIVKEMYCLWTVFGNNGRVV